MPRAVLSAIRELHVPADKVEEAKKEAETLPAFDITEVRARPLPFSYPSLTLALP